MQLKFIQIGNSDGIIVPKKLMEEFNFKRGDSVIAVRNSDGEGIVLKPQKKTIQVKETSRSTSGEFKRWLKGVLKEDAEVLEELSVR